MMAASEKNLIKRESGLWEVVIGLEMHAQITAETKLFSAASAAYGGEANMQVSLVDAAMPGMLPVINPLCVEQAVRAALGIGAHVHEVSIFERKNYFYPDLPQGYQISQYQHPLATGGEVILDMPDDETIAIRVERLHMEQDAGKSLHGVGGETLIDLNRAGIGLMEIVSQPDMRSAAQAQAYIRKMRSVLRYLGVCDGNMEEGSLRADINVSVRHPGEELGQRAEVKNVNSIRFAGQAIAYEITRQIEALENGQTLKQQTRLFDPAQGMTRPMRDKEDAHDYRYFPDPDLPPLVLEAAFIKKIAASLPELPDAKKQRFITDYGLTPYDASVLTAERARADYFEAVAKGRNANQAAHWITGELLGGLNKKGVDISRSPIAPGALGELLDLIADETLSGKIAKQVFEIMLEEGGTPSAIVDAKNLRQITDETVLEKIIDDILAQNPDKLAQAQKKPRMLGWFTGQVMQATKGQANPQKLNAILRKKTGL